MASIASIANQVSSNITGKMTSVQKDMVAKAPDEQKPFLEAQFKLENEAQITQQITNMLKKLDEMSMAVIRNLA
ncbi:hypothetical protein [Hyalangium versicolor]|uniref:hypothetical protein n=1 Tax=Hyalangium versicolor TaxID=2861190 RepID=UPI001CC9AAB7|nr:hypothetical protein [Hyalangium versicolor]